MTDQAEEETPKTPISSSELEQQLEKLSLEQEKSSEESSEKSTSFEGRAVYAQPFSYPQQEVTSVDGMSQAQGQAFYYQPHGFVEIRQPYQGVNLHVARLPDSATEEKMLKLFKPFGQCEVRLPMFSQDDDSDDSDDSSKRQGKRKHRGYGFVTFERQEDAQKALQADLVMDRNSINLCLAKKGPRQKRRQPQQVQSYYAPHPQYVSYPTGQQNPMLQGQVFFVQQPYYYQTSPQHGQSPHYYQQYQQPTIYVVPQPYSTTIQKRDD